MPIELGFTGSSHVFACGGGVSRQSTSIIHNIVSSGGHLYALYLLLLSLNIGCTLPWVYWWHLKAHTHTHTIQIRSKLYIHTHKQVTVAHSDPHGNTGVCFMHIQSCTCTHALTNTHTQFAQTKAQTAVLVISAPSESIWWIECLELLRLTDGTRILNAAQKGTLCIAQGSCAHTHSYCNKTHTHARKRTCTRKYKLCYAS